MLISQRMYIFAILISQKSSHFETCKKVCVFDSAPTLGLYKMSKPNVVLRVTLSLCFRSRFAEYIQSFF